MAYFDQLLTDYTVSSGNITMTITLPPSIDVSNMVFFFYAFIMNGTYEWDAAPPDFYVDYVTFNNATNQIIIKMEPFMFSNGFMSAMAYLTIEEVEEVLQEIPGYDMFLMSLMLIIVSSLIIKKVRKKK